jgi:alpha-glucuronidase
MYESLESTPDDLLLWFHHVDYTYKLHSGKTVIQHFYDAHYEGADTAQTFPTEWQKLEGKIDSERFNEVMFRLVFQAGHSIVWRDSIVNFYHNLSGIADDAKRVGNHPWRIEAEAMTLSNYEPYTVSPFEAASNYTAIVTTSNSTAGTATTKVNFASGTYDLGVNYYDMDNGISTWTLWLGSDKIGSWLGNAENTLGHAPSVYLDGHSATRITFKGVKVTKGVELKIEGQSDGLEPAPLDYVVFLPNGVID